MWRARGRIKSSQLGLVKFTSALKLYALGVYRDICFQKCIYEKQYQQKPEMLQGLTVFAKLNMSITPLVFSFPFLLYNQHVGRWLLSLYLFN